LSRTEKTTMFDTLPGLANPLAKACSASSRSPSISTPRSPLPRKTASTASTFFPHSPGVSGSTTKSGPMSACPSSTATGSGSRHVSGSGSWTVTAASQLDAVSDDGAPIPGSHHRTLLTKEFAQSTGGSGRSSELAAADSVPGTEAMGRQSEGRGYSGGQITRFSARTQIPGPTPALTTSSQSTCCVQALKARSSSASWSQADQSRSI
jgi:hypothetical protein